MTVKELKAALEGMQLDPKGTKAVLVARLQEAQAAAGEALLFPVLHDACQALDDL